MIQPHPASLHHGTERSVEGYPGLESAECQVCRHTITNDSGDPDNAWRHAIHTELDAPGPDPLS